MSHRALRARDRGDVSVSLCRNFVQKVGVDVASLSGLRWIKDWIVSESSDISVSMLMAAGLM